MTALAAWLLTACGVVLVGIGGFFLTLRPPLLPEDVQFMGSTFGDIVTALPGLTRWLRRVFWVLGGYIATSGLLVVYVATTGLRAGDTDALSVLALAGVTSVGWMTVVNFLIHSHFKWALLALDVLWAIALLLAASRRGREPKRQRAGRRTRNVRTFRPAAADATSADSTPKRAVCSPDDVRS